MRRWQLSVRPDGPMERSKKQDWVDDKQYFVKTVTERKNGELVVVSTEIVKR